MDEYAQSVPAQSAAYTWFWQTCNEFGFFQTGRPAASGETMYTPAVSDASLWGDLCADVFGVYDVESRIEVGGGCFRLSSAIASAVMVFSAVYRTYQSSNSSAHGESRDRWGRVGFLFHHPDLFPSLSPRTISSDANAPNLSTSFILKMFPNPNPNVYHFPRKRASFTISTSRGSAIRCTSMESTIPGPCCRGGRRSTSRIRSSTVFW